MTGNLIVSLSFVVLAALCILGSIFVLSRVKYNPGAGTEINIPFLGTMKTDVPAIGGLLVGIVFAGFAYDLQRPNKIEFVNFTGKVHIDPEVLRDVPAVVVGVTTSRWNLTETPRDNGTMEITIPVPNNWDNYTAYAFAHGVPSVRPAVEGLRLDAASFELDLKR
ncbi:hypothetical protein [Ciceribacter sp. L1K22]|uniref:hypothetical protein n=1 Tax=Ciceribacter sp. L1K22 TaxID=2820275 RepID=UPI001ABE994E|nr:hypothetical protein [Ciceribacter sp. L1K22]MBO3760805.1 hypothetical protein [Ciceribacter sp. L1K22]